MSSTTSVGLKRKMPEGLRRHGANLVALGVIQGANAAIPLVVFPYLLSVIGADSYAQLVMAEALAVLGLAVVVYSFEIDGVARVAGSDIDKDSKKISRAFSEILTARLTLFGACLAMALLGGLFLPQVVYTLLLGWMLLPLSFALQPNWLFQALEDNFAPALAVLFSRLLAASLVVLCIKKAADCWKVPFLLGLPYLAASVATSWWACHKYKLELSPVGWREIFRILCRGREVFAGNVSVMLYREFNVVLLGMAGVIGSGIAAYSLAEKLTKGVQAVARPLAQLLFPRALLSIRDRSVPDREVLRRLWYFVYPQWAALSGVIATLASLWFLVRGHPHVENFPQSEQIARLTGLMLPAVFAGVASFMLGGAGLNHLRARQDYFRYIFGAGIVNVALCLALSSAIGPHGAAISFVAAELLLLGMVVRRYRLRNPKGVVHV